MAWRLGEILEHCIFLSYFSSLFLFLLTFVRSFSTIKIISYWHNIKGSKSAKILTINFSFSLRLSVHSLSLVLSPSFLLFASSLHFSILLSSMYGIAKSFYSFRFLALPIIPGVMASLRLFLTLPRALSPLFSTPLASSSSSSSSAPWRTPLLNFLRGTRLRD